MADMRLVNEADEYLARMDNAFAECRGQHHDWPILKIGRKPPRNWRGVRQADGCFRITETCKNCGMERTTTTLPGGLTDENARYAYSRPDNWVVIPRDADVSKKDIRAELHRRCAPEILAAAPAEGMEPPAEPVPVRYPKVPASRQAAPGQSQDQGDGLAPVFAFGRRLA